MEAGFIVLGGPLADEQRVIYAVEAASDKDVRITIARDPWWDSHLRLDWIEPWTVKLDGASRSSTPSRSRRSATDQSLWT